MKSWICITAVLLLDATSRGASFQNLGFDVADVSKVDSEFSRFGGVGAASDLLPGWQLYQGETRVTQIRYDEISIGSRHGAATLFDNDPRGPFAAWPRAEDRFALLLEEGIGEEPFVLVQTGEIPASAVFLRYKYFADPMSLSVNGISVPPVDGSFDYVLNTSGTLGQEVFDISQFAGQEVELRLTTLWLFPWGTPPYQVLDSIAFMSVIPEPEHLVVLGLTALGAVLYFARCRGVGAGCDRKRNWP